MITYAPRMMMVSVIALHTLAIQLARGREPGRASSARTDLYEVLRKKSPGTVRRSWPLREGPRPAFSARRVKHTKIAKRGAFRLQPRNSLPRPTGGGGPRVRILLPPAGSPVRTDFGAKDWQQVAGLQRARRGIRAKPHRPAIARPESAQIRSGSQWQPEKATRLAQGEHTRSTNSSGTLCVTSTRRSKPRLRAAASSAGM